MKLIDFGMATIKQDFLVSVSWSFFSSNSDQAAPGCEVGPRGKPSYQAPEMHEQVSYETSKHSMCEGVGACKASLLQARYMRTFG